MITIVIMGIVFAIASSTWFNVVESRRVDSAANQLASDMRRAHSSATNRLASWQVVMTANSSEYSMTGSASPRDLDDDSAGHLVVADTTVTITFKSDGSATVDPAGTNSFKVRSSRDASNDHTIQFNTATSRVKIVD